MTEHEALKSLSNEVSGLLGMPGLREAIGNTNLAVLRDRLENAQAALAAAPAVGGERLWCSACGTVTRDMLCDCNRWPDGHEMKREPHFVNYADTMQETAHEQAQQIAKLEAQLAATPASPLRGREPVAWRWRTLPKFSEDAADRQWQLTPTAPNFINPHHHEVEPLFASPPEQPAADQEWRSIDTIPQDRPIDGWHKVWKCPVTIAYRVDRSAWVEKTLTTEWPIEAFTHWRETSTAPDKNPDSSALMPPRTD